MVGSKVKLVGFTILSLMFFVFLILISQKPSVVLAVIQSKQYNASGALVKNGTVISGTLEDTKVLGDGLSYDIQEISTGTSTSQLPVTNMNFTTDSSGWIYGEVDDNSVATGSWQSTGGHYDAGVYQMTHDDANVRSNPTSEQWINYSFTVSTVPNSARVFAWYRLTCDDDTQFHAEVRLILPNGSEFTLNSSQTYTSGGTDTGWIGVDVDASSLFDQVGTYTLKLYVQTGPAPKNADRPTNVAYWDDAGVELVYSNYRVEVWFNGTIDVTNVQTLNVSVNFSSTTDATYYLEIFNFSSNSWVSCQSGSITSNSWQMWWCNITTSPSDFISNDNVTIRLYDDEHIGQGILKNDYVQFYVSYEVTVTRWLEVNYTTSSQINYWSCTQSSPCAFTQNSTFMVEAVVTCHTDPPGYDCGTVYGAVRYNNSSSEPDTLISTTQGDKPFFIQETSPENPKSCGTLSDGSSCTLSWNLNATGDTLPVVYALDVNFTSITYGVENDTLNSFVKINPQTYINVVLSNVPICFGSVSGGDVEVSASDGSKPECGTGIKGFPMNVYIESNVNTSLWLRGDSDLVNDSNSISVTNLRCANSSTPSEKKSLVLGNYILFQANIETDTTVPIYWWLYLPAGTPPGDYSGNITILVNESA